MRISCRGRGSLALRRGISRQSGPGARRAGRRWRDEEARDVRHLGPRQLHNCLPKPACIVVVVVVAVVVVVLVGVVILVMLVIVPIVIVVRVVLVVLL